MKRPRIKLASVAFAAALAGLAVAIPAIGQDAPTSLLPPGFGEPDKAPPPPTDSLPVEGDPDDAMPSLALTPPDAAATNDMVLLPEEQTAADQAARDAELPEAARQSLDQVGALGPGDGGLGENAFGQADGRYLVTLMDRLDAPVASRWASILLRRALLSRVANPRYVPVPDWVATRAWLLLRMGEADGARMLVQKVDTDRYTPRLYAIAAQTALATADPAALCAIAEAGEQLSDEALWPLARAMCAGLSGDAGTSAALIDRVRTKRLASGIDLLLAEKVVGAGTNSRRAVTLDWTPVDRLTAWRFGLASALGVAIPDSLYPTAGPQVEAWRARTPMIAPDRRLAAARVAAAIGPMSSRALIDLYGAIAEDTDPAAFAGTTAAKLRTAYVADDPADRLAALRALWSEAGNARDRYAAAILTARAATRIRPDASYSGDAAQLIGAMLAAGFDRQAAQWGAVVNAMGGAGDEAWGLLAVGAPRLDGPVDARRLSGLADRRRAQLLLAGLAGLGRLSGRDTASLAGELGVAIGGADRWTRAIDEAGAAHAPGTVALLAAVGLQSRNWTGVSAAHLYHIVAALRRSGQEPIARMVAAEALSRS